MTSCKVLFLLIFLMASDQEYTVATDLAVAKARNSSLMIKSSGEKIIPTTRVDTHLKRKRRSSDTVKRSFTIFAKRVWNGFRLYLQGKTLLNKRFGPENVEKIIKLSVLRNKTDNSNVTAPVDFVPLLTENEELMSSTALPLSEKQTNLRNQTQSQQNVYHYLRQKWKNQLVSENYDETQPAIVNYVQSLSLNAVNIYQTLNRNTNRWYLWKMKTADTPSSDYTTQFQNLYKLTLAYGTNGTLYYKNKRILNSVIEGLDFMVTAKGYDGEKYHGTWWHWLIGVPDTFTKIMIVINDELSQQQKDLYIRIVNNYVSNPLITKRLNNINVGAYSCSLAETVLALGILQEDEDAIKLSTDTVIEVLNQNRKGIRSFYPDGSFVHKYIPYNGLYGKDLIKSVAQIIFVTKDSDYELASIVIQSLLNIVHSAFIPLMYEGEMIAPVCGRAVSRAQSNTKIGYGSSLPYDLLIISKSASQHSQKRLQEAVKFWMRRNLNYYLTNTRNYYDISMMTELLNDGSITGDELPFYGAKLYASMDRFVQRTPDYMFGLALHSSRISAFDAGDNENKRSWHTADGMTYLYNDDEVQFNSAYWPTVDPYRLPGTTVDTIHLFDELLNSRMTSAENWVGGVTNNNQAVVGMSLNKKDSKNRGMVLAMDLRAKKSWFIVEGQIVALGAGITGNTKSSIETIVDDRLLNDKLNYLILTNEGVVYDPAAAAVALYVEKRKRRLKVLWILLQESSHKASIGYYFPTKETIHVISERRSGTYFDINEQFMSTDTFAGNYSKLLIHHGRKPANVSYAYVLLPGITKHYLKEYAETNPVTILANTEDIQAVKIKDHNYIGINIWNKFGGEIAGISSNKPMSLLKQTKNNEDTYVVSDPTQSNSTIQVKIPDFTKVVRMSEGVEYDGEYNVFIINFENRCGASQQFTVLYIAYENIHL